MESRLDSNINVHVSECEALLRDKHSIPNDETLYIFPFDEAKSSSISDKDMVAHVYDERNAG